MSPRNLAAMAATLVAMSACNAQTSATTAPASSTSTKPTDVTSADELQALLTKTLKNLRFVEGGSFQMGDFGPVHSPEKLYYSSRTDNKPMHKVTLDSFSMSAYKTTYEEHDIYSRATGKPLVGQDKITVDYRFPNAAAGLNWYQAREYCQWLGVQLKLPMDVPTEAQWEYAARNRGAFFLFATDNGKVDAGRNVWEFDQRNAAVEATGAEFTPPSLPLGQFPPTPLGLFDMMTDGYEWTLDWYAADYYQASPEHNPKGPEKGKLKVLRSWRSADGEGLSYGDGMSITRSKRAPNPPGFNTYRNKPDPTINMTDDTAARCVVNSPQPVKATN